MFRVSNSRVVDEVGNIVPARKFWDLSKSGSPETPDLELSGIAEPLLVLDVNGSELILTLKFKGDFEVFNSPIFLDETWDHFVDSSVWLPLDQEQLKSIFSSMLEMKIVIGETISKGQYFKLASACTSLGCELIVQGDIDSAIQKLGSEPDLSLLEGVAYDYQTIGIRWLADYFDNGLGALLCDEMGLGKTYQAIGVMAHAVARNETPILIICPASLIKNWEIELSKFLPSVGFYTHFGPHRSFDIEKLKRNKIVISTYDLLINDFPLFGGIEWELLVCDEAQALKNRQVKRHIASSQLHAKSKILVTGTPIENSLKDLWSLTNIVAPGLLGDAKSFETLIEDTPAEASRIGKRAAPFILRRNVSEVATDLPPLVEINEAIQPSEAFVNAYEEARNRASSSKTSFLVVLNQLIQICCFPDLIFEGFKDSSDAKIERLTEILDELNSIGNDKVIIFSTFTKSIDILNSLINLRYGTGKSQVIDGRNAPSSRQQIIDDFNESQGFKVLIINPKAGGTGLNITGANHVIHFNRQWNPQLERQATARAYRRKQTKTVFVHKFFYVGTIEQVINERLFSKEELADSALENALTDEEDVMRAKALLISPLNK